ncbi:RimK family alpha-L-glutamate ligase [Aureibaculum marinum]|uniref:RimK family alpha-L-glutamate ligase n=1 Tax=Aureibaculum marinum TaxID=2487930 RepID=A0A3N4NUJ4_9FLAO|nr:RimK family alpha-L-glutamate ligase [Aureibaculum marinum]RPD96706.1 RimK family alpha-L-glutamate ligase [Aureibaculum marinum]
MNIYILSVGKNIYSTNRLVQEAKNLGHSIHVINHTQCSVKLGKGKPQLIFEGKNIIDIPDVIIPRIGTSVSKHGAAIVKEFEMNGVYSTASSLGILRAQNKIRTLQIMNQKNIPIPQTVFSINPKNIDEQIELLGGPPVIIKLQEGTQGTGVILAESRKSAKSIMDTFYNMNTSFLVQEFIEESNSEDVRIIVAGDQIIASMKRKGEIDEFRSNLHRGGTGEIAYLTNQEKKMALEASKHLNLPIAGVDIIRSKKGPLLLEVNASPGLQGIEAYTQINVAYYIIKHIEKNVRKRI